MTNMHRVSSSFLQSREFATALLASFAAYAALLTLLPLHAVSAYDGIFVGVLGLAVVAWLVRRAVANRCGDSRIVGWLITCRRATFWVRASAAVSLVVLALIYDRYFDGDPANFRMASFVVPVLASIILFDAAAATFAIGIGALAVDYFFIEPVYEFTITTLSDALDLVMYVVICAQVVINIDAFINGGQKESHT